MIGFPLLHSKSPALHGLLYKAVNKKAITLPFSHSDIRKLVASIRTLSVQLIAVTMPFKQSVMPLLDSVEKKAAEVDAVNTIINRNGKLIGHNTDIFGIEYALRNTVLKNKNVLLLGAGGAAYAVAYVIKKKGGKLIYINRTESRAKSLQKKFGGRIAKLSNLTPKDINVIINATPIGQRPNVKSTPIGESLLAKHQTIFDLVYNPLQTKLIQLARKKGVKTISGIDMFVAQGARQVELWTGKKIITPRLVEKLKRAVIKELI